MKARYFSLLAVAVLLASCAKEALTEKPEIHTGKTVLTVGVAPQTMVSMGPADAQGHRQLFWSNGDQIAVNGEISDALENVAEECTSVDFTFEGQLTTPYNVLYPASIYTDATHVTLPASQAYKEGGIADGVLPMAGYSADGSSITVSSLCAIVKIQVKRAATSPDEDNLVAVRFQGRNAEQVSGEFTIDYQNGTLTSGQYGAADEVVRAVKNLETSTGAPCVYHVVVPAQTYSQGFDVIVQDVNGHIMTKSKTASITLEAGHMYTMPEFEFVPTGTELGVEINSAQDLIDFANAFNSKQFEGLGSSLVVTLKNDITFDATTSAAFNATHGIGQKKNIHGATADNYFSGVFNGGNHVINGLEATEPVFAYTQSDGQINDLTLDASCTFTVNPSAADPNHGPLVGRNKGIVKNCKSYSEVTINNIQDVNSTAQHYGGLVGRNYGGTIENCDVEADIVCAQTGQTITKGTDLAVYIAGIAGTQANGGEVNGCSFTGNIAVHDDTTYGGITANGTYFYVGGIVGYAENGIISNCTTGENGESTSIDVRGSFVPAVGGILGWSKSATDSEISNCNNYAALSVSSNGARGDTTPLRIGGIAARSAADIKDCNNAGTITSVSNSTTLELGGIVGDGANVSNCNNQAGGTITRSNAEATATQTNRYIYMGGIMGTNNVACDISDCKNFAAVTSNAIGTATQTTADLGGILGSGGSSSAPLQVDIESCENNGNVTLVNSGTTVTTRLSVGGIIGYAPAANTTIKSCDNKAQVYCNSQQNAAGRVAYSGGIAGLMGAITAGVDGLEIDHCTNSARVWNRNYNNTVSPASSTPFGGGIVGAIIGTSTSPAYIHDCSTSGADVVELRGYCGGIAGYTGLATIENSTVAQALTGSNANSQGAGGLVGWAVSSAISGCTTSANVNTVKNVAGLVAKLDTGSSITGCRLNGAALTKGTNAAATAAAVLVSVAADGVTITNCGVKGTIDGASITLSSNMVTTDGGANVTGTYIIE